MRESKTGNISSARQSANLKRGTSFNAGLGVESTYRLEPNSPGLGLPVTGQELKKVTQNILASLDDEIEE